MAQMSRDELLELIKTEAGRAIHAAVESAFSGDGLKQAVEEAVAPLKERQTSWFEEMRRGIAEDPKGAPKKVDRVQTVSRMACAIAATRGHMDAALAWARETWAGDDALVKAMEAGRPTAGGFLVPEEFSADVIESLKAAAVVRRLQPVVMPMGAATVRLPKITAGASASYVGESTVVAASELGTGQVTLSFKKLAAKVPISNDLLRYSAPAADAVVRNDMIRALAAREDQAFIRDNGTAGTPKGLRHWALASGIIAATATVNLANVSVDLGKLVLQLKKNNIPMTRPAWIFSPRTEHYLATVQNSNGFFVFRDEILRGTLWGFPIGVTTNVPENLTDGGGTTETEVYLVDMADAVIGEAQRLILRVSDEAAYNDGSSVVSAFDRDETVVLGLMEHDFAMRRDEAVAVLNQVTWGA